MRRGIVLAACILVIVLLMVNTVSHAFLPLLALGLGFLIGYAVTAILLNPGPGYVKAAAKQMQSDLSNYANTVASMVGQTAKIRGEDAQQYAVLLPYSQNYYIRWAESIASAHCNNGEFNITWFEELKNDLLNNYMAYVKMYVYAKAGYFTMLASANKAMLSSARPEVKVPIFSVEWSDGNTYTPSEPVSIVGLDEYREEVSQYLDTIAENVITNSTASAPSPKILIKFGNMELECASSTCVSPTTTTVGSVSYAFYNISRYNIVVTTTNVTVVNGVLPISTKDPFTGSTGTVDIANIYTTIISDAYTYWQAEHEEAVNNNGTCSVLPPPSIVLPVDPKEAWKLDPVAMNALYLSYLRALKNHNWTADPELGLNDLGNFTDQMVWVKGDLDTNGDGVPDYTGGYFIPVGVNGPATFEVGKNTTLTNGGWGFYYENGTLTPVQIQPGGGVLNVQGIHEMKPEPIDLNGDGVPDTLQYKPASNSTELTINPANAQDFIKTVPKLPDSAWQFVPDMYKGYFNPPNLLSGITSWFGGIDKTKLLLAGAGLLLVIIIIVAAAGRSAPHGRRKR